MNFYVYEWFIKDTNEIIYVGKGCKRRYLVKKHNSLFNEFIKRFDCESRIIAYYDTEEKAFVGEFDRINELKAIGQCVCNIYKGGFGGETKSWTTEKREKYSKNNVMKSQKQRERMSKYNPMKNKDIASRVNAKHRKPVYINNVYYAGVKIAANELNVAEITIISWCKKGYDTQGKPCRYADEEQKEYSNIKKTHPKATVFRAVIIDNIKFETVKDGALYIGVASETLIRALKNNKLCKGHLCKYDNQQPSHTNTDKSSMKGSTTNG